MAWVDLSAAFGYGTKLTSTQMQNLRDNIAAAFAKDSGAPTLANSYVVENMIGSNAVTAAKINDGSITVDKIGSNAVTAVKIIDGAVTEAKIGAVAVVAAKIGTGAVTEAKVGADAVTIAKLKTSDSELSTAYGTGEHLEFTGGYYCHYPRVNFSINTIAYINDSASTSSAWETRIFLKPNNDVTVYATSRYHTSSGEVFWIFIQRDKKTREIISQSCAPDHVCFGNGGKPLLVQHPFCDVLSDSDGFYHPENGKKRRVEIVVLNPDKEIVRHCYKKMLSNNPRKADKNFTQAFNEQMDYTTSNLKKTKWIKKPVTVGLKNDIDWSYGEEEPVLAIIPRPKNIILGRVKLRN